MSILEFHDVSILKSGRPLLEGINWQVLPNEHWVVLGPNGSGKSTLVMAAMARIWPTHGNVWIFEKPYTGNEVKKLNSRAGLFQPALHDSLGEYHSNMNVLDVLLTGLDGNIANYSNYSYEQINICRVFFEDVSLISSFNFNLQTKMTLLSSGERRQVLLFRSVLNDPDLLFLDEPFESLDLTARVRLERLLKKTVISRLQSSIMILHRTEEIPEFTTHILLLKNGQVFSQGKLEEILIEPVIAELFDLELNLVRNNNRYYCVVK